jgi:hypothetical protein
LTEKVILNLTDCDSLSNHVTAKTTDEKVISLTESDALLNQHDVLDATEHVPAYGDEFGTCGVIFSMGDDTRDTVWCKQFTAIDYSFNEIGLVICISRHGTPIVITQKFSKWKITWKMHEDATRVTP